MSKLLQKVGPLRIHSLNKPGGKPTFRVSGSVDGERLRKQFRDQTAALDWASAQAKAATIQTVVPELADAGLPIRDQLEARRVYAELRAGYPGTSLSEVWGFFQRHHQNITPITTEEAVRRYAAQRNAEFSNHELSKAHSSELARFLSKFLAVIGPETPLTGLTKDELQRFIRGAYRDSEQSEYANKTLSNRRGYLMHFFAWAVDQCYLQFHPLASTRSYKQKKKRSPDGAPNIAIITAEQAAALMAHVERHHEGRLVPYFALCLFAGIRPDWKEGEIQRFQFNFINDQKTEMVLPQWMTKTGKTRKIQISANLREWLTRYPADNFPIVARNFKKLYAQVRKEFSLEHDVLRHTYISMLVASTKSIAEAALQAGNTEDIVWSSYLNLGISNEAAQKFWAIAPDASFAHANRIAVKPPLRMSADYESDGSLVV